MEIFNIDIGYVFGLIVAIASTVAGYLKTNGKDRKHINELDTQLEALVGTVEITEKILTDAIKSKKELEQQVFSADEKILRLEAEGRDAIEAAVVAKYKGLAMRRLGPEATKKIFG